MSRSASASYNNPNLHEESPSDRDYSRNTYTTSSSTAYTRDPRDSRDYSRRDYNNSRVTDDGTHSGKWTSAKEVSDRDLRRGDNSRDAPSDWNINVGPMFPQTGHNQSYGVYDNYENNHPSTLGSIFRGRSNSFDRSHDREYSAGHRDLSRDYTTTSTSYQQPRTSYTTSYVSYPAHQYSYGSYHPSYQYGAQHYGAQHYGAQHFGGQHYGGGQPQGLGAFMTAHPHTSQSLGGSDYSNYSRSGYGDLGNAHSFGGQRGYSNRDFIDFDNDYDYSSSRSYGGVHHYGGGQPQGLGAFMMAHPHNSQAFGGSNFSSSSRGLGGFTQYGSHGQQPQGLGAFLVSHPNPHPLGELGYSDFNNQSQFGGFGQQSRGFASTNPFTSQFQSSGYQGDYSSYGQGQEFKNKQHKIDLYQVSNDYVIEMDLPGFSRDAVEIKYLNNELVISARPPQSSISNFMQRERKVRDVCRKVQLPSGVNVGGITAVLSNGVLKVTVPRDNSSTIGAVSSSSF